jgi:hypothetical protein
MCYTGKCHYEDYLGECTIKDIKDIPDDAGCVIAEIEIEKIEKENFLKNNVRF